MKDSKTDLFNDHMQQSYGKVRDYVKKMCRNQQEAEDITQEAFLRAFRYFDQFNGSSSFDTWVTTIARNYYFDVRRQAKRRVEVLPLEPAVFSQILEHVVDERASVDAILDRLTRENALSGILSALKDARYKIIWMIAVEGHTYSEVAAKLNVRIGTVKSRYNRQLRAIRQWHQDNVLSGSLAPVS